METCKKNFSVKSDEWVGGILNDFSNQVVPYDLHYAYRVKVEKGWYGDVQEIMTAIKLCLEFLFANERTYEALYPAETDAETMGNHYK